MKIAVAQVPSIRGDVEANILTHLHAVEKAAAEEINYLVFPELSLTGYELDLAEKLAFSIDDKRLQPLLNSAKEHAIHVGVGVPWRTLDSLKLGFFVLSPEGNISPYAKIHLHGDEDKYFSPGDTYHISNIEGLTVASAICADTNNPDHAATYASMGASVYVAGVLLNKRAYDIDRVDLAGYASKFNMLVAIANHSAMTGGYEPVGLSSIWSVNGLIAIASGIQNSLVIAEMINNDWAGTVVEI